MDAPRFRQLRRDELDTALAWAEAEGWNPGLADAEAFWAADPDGFWGMEAGEELIGTASTVVYTGSRGEKGNLGFVGLFIVRPEWRGRGVGTAFWDFFIAQMQERLGGEAGEGGAALDGVFAMQEYYGRSGFRFTHRNLRMEGVGVAVPPDPALIDAATAVDFEELLAFDRLHFGAERRDFLRRWIHPQGGSALAVRGKGRGESGEGNLRGYGVIRPCRRGFKIGPLFADDPAVAEALFAGLSSHAAGEPVFLDVPENHSAALDLATRHGLRQQFGCARMISGSFPRLPWERIYGVTTFELG